MTAGRTLTENELDAIRELANVGAGAAATELYRLTRREIRLEVPHARVLPLEDVLDAFGPPEAEVTAVGVELSGGLDMLMALLLRPGAADEIARGIGEAPERAVVELAERLSTGFAASLSTLTHTAIHARVAGVTTDMLGAIVQSITAPDAANQSDMLLVELSLLGRKEALRLLCAPRSGSIEALLARLGVAPGDDAST